MALLSYRIYMRKVPCVENRGYEFRVKMRKLILTFL